MKDYTVLDRYCEIAHITYYELGEMLDMHWNTLYAIVKGRSRPSKRNARKLDRWWKKNKEKVMETITSESMSIPTT